MIIITIGQMVDFKLDYRRFSQFGTKNSRNDEYCSHRHICKLHALQLGELLLWRDDQMLKMISFIYFLWQWFLLSWEKKFPQPPCKSFSYRLERSFISHDAVTQSLFSKLHLFVSLSREFSRYMNGLVQTVLHDVSIAGVQSETIWFKTENATAKKCKCA